MAKKSEIMYVACTGPGQRMVWARIGRVQTSKTGRTLYYGGRELRGQGQPWYRDVDTGEVFVVQHARKDGLDRNEGHKGGSFPVEIDDDVRDQYWERIREEPKRRHERIIHC